MVVLEYCKTLDYDVLVGLTELHNNQAKPQFQVKRWICSDVAEQGADPAAGMAILLSPRMTHSVLRCGHVGRRIAWVRLEGPICNLFIVVAYIPHKGRSVHPTAQDTLKQIDTLLKTVPKQDCIIILGGDLNCQLQRNVPARLYGQVEHDTEAR